jgi:hypothetical protein
VALHRRQPQCEHRSPFTTSARWHIPPGQRGERLRLRGARVAALALERQDVLVAACLMRLAGNHSRYLQSVGIQIASITMAVPWPTPTHIVHSA